MITHTIYLEQLPGNAIEIVCNHLIQYGNRTILADGVLITFDFEIMSVTPPPDEVPI
jgi:hypothetical protein